MIHEFRSLAGTVSDYELSIIVAIKNLRLYSAKTTLLGVNDGTGIVFRDDEAVRVGQADGGIQAIWVFQGVGQWGHDKFGIFIRECDELAEQF
ncbi:hypothetical protein SLH49_01330 [Cognatiyoonia sp. IB215446]|uniref:hypothetical protein n=1 Tax=Cognatiyoonia sp. IB215446 TaxID=3097355 RepID=UPI002A14877D|nr:hypothetical protein [Cognatiyoonia sp. IB215446]MDX8346613.1 hypothetical protein [Cognatiyoonia sp. IB215446]